MSRNNQKHIDAGIRQLVGHIIPKARREEDKDFIQETVDENIELAHAILNDTSSPAISADSNHAHDLIKKKLVQTNPSAALRFTNLYTRLLSVPVLQQKWAILYLLYQLADSPDADEPLPLEALKEVAENRRVESIRRSETDPSPQASKKSSKDDEHFRDAFQPKGSRKFPSDDARQGPGKLRREDEDEIMTDVGNGGPPETTLLRDLPFTLQGLSSTSLPFTKEGTLKLPPTLPVPMISLLHSLAEPSLLYKSLTEWVSTPAGGLLGQSLRAAVNGELRAYLNLVATLEVQIRRALAALDEAGPHGGLGKCGVTLKRCVVWTREATMGLRLLSLIAEESKSKRGGQLISLIHGFSTSHGDPIVAAFAERLLGSVTRPFYDILRHWMYDGELHDPYREFFVREQDPKDEEWQDLKARGMSSVWNDKYEVEKGMIPSIITNEFAQKVFLIGKSLNFIRHSCGDAPWVDDYSKSSSKELRYGDTATLEAWIDVAYKTTMQRLMDLMTNKFLLFKHLRALKSFLLMGQGDFVVLLMESLSANLDRPAGAQYRHTLTDKLEGAIRGSNAQFESPEVLRRLDARMLQLSHGDIGWDCFTLEYKVDAPADVVVTPWGNKQYLKVFNFLWKIKRVEFGLSSTWRRCMTGARGVLQTNDAVVLETWKSTRGVLAEMIHFIGQLQHYILFEVIESSWDELQKGVTKEGCTLDDLIKAHSKFLNSITRKGLLGAKLKAYHDASRGDDQTGYLVQLKDILDNMLSYRDSVDGLYSWSVSEFTRRQEADARATSTTVHGGTTTSATAAFDSPGAGGGFNSEFPVLQERLKMLSAAFQKKLCALLGDLAYQPDVDLRFLGVAMNFNDVYVPTRPKSSRHRGTVSAAAAAALYDIDW
ncbi:Spc98 family-domain-containing protein [Coniella lustricola]|uniref:Spc98 family-domain-containing protein n=1 Tax=Coniella lustricola TaxID=2025994 RepID=A0A2T3ACP1_9PEZI|nr:Spc98 family-domain-containing protein [Coniella lustricola]